MDMGRCYTEFHALCDRLTTGRITRETLSYNNPCPSSPSSTIYIYIYIGWSYTIQLDALWFPGGVQFISFDITASIP